MIPISSATGLLATAGHADQPEPVLCRREHRTVTVGRLGVVCCSGNTWAWPDDAEGQADGHEVACQCDGFDAASRERANGD